MASSQREKAHPISGKPIYYADLTVHKGMTLEQALEHARQIHQQRTAVGYANRDLKPLLLKMALMKPWTLRKILYRATSQDSSPYNQAIVKRETIKSSN